VGGDIGIEWDKGAGWKGKLFVTRVGIAEQDIGTTE
jgi:hypothetical protein